LSVHPHVEQLGQDALDILLVQSLYKYLNDISGIETRVINNVIMRAMCDFPIELHSDQKIQLYTVMTDEVYHAYVAYDAMLQIQENTNISPLPLPKTIEIESSLEAIKLKLEPKYHIVFELIAVCLAENTLTKEIVMMLADESIHPFFQMMLKNHLVDESRHSGIFYHLLKYIWQNISDEYKYNIGFVLPKFLRLYLGVSVQIYFDKTVLLHLGLSEKSANEAIDDTYGGFKLSQHHPMLKNILLILSKAGVLDDFVEPHFRAEGLIN